MKEWYLLTPQTRPNEIGGYENDAFVDYRDDAFQEALSTEIASTVLLYNSNLSQHKTIRCIIQNNIADTQLKSIERTVLGSVGTFKAGMYIFFEDQYWLLTGYPGNNGIYEKVTMILCQYQLRWQHESGRIIERWANLTSASKYDTGRSGNQVIVLASNNFTILMPEDDDVASIDDKRVFIDRDLKNPKKVFRITRSDDVLYLYGKKHGGILSFIADRDELNTETDRPDLRLCDYIEQRPSQKPDNDITQDVIVDIFGDPFIKNGYSRDYVIQFRNDDNKVVEPMEFACKINSDFEVNYSIKGNLVTLFADSEENIGQTFQMQIFVDDQVEAQMDIMLVEAF